MIITIVLAHLEVWRKKVVFIMAANASQILAFRHQIVMDDYEIY